MSVLALIPARGGSKRFPGKNLALFNGKPLLSYPIAAARESNCIDMVVVSTEDPNIAQAAKECGAEVPFVRPQELATSESPVIETIAHALGALKDWGYAPDYVVLLQATSPQITAKEIDTAIKLAQEKGADSVVAVSSVDNLNHPYNIRAINQEDGTIGFWKQREHYEYSKNAHTKPEFFKAANIWVTTPSVILNERRLEGKMNIPLVLDAYYSFDIDYPDDLPFLEAVVNARKK